MTNKDNQEKQYSIYIKNTHKWVPVSKEDFNNYYRGINAYRRTEQNHGRCTCPASKRLMCDMDCFNCPYRTCGDTSSLNNNRTDEDGNEMNWLDELQEKMPELQTPSAAECVADSIDMKKIIARLSELMPQAIEIGILREKGLSEDAIAAKIGTGRKTYAYRIKKVEEILKIEFPEYF